MWGNGIESTRGIEVDGVRLRDACAWVGSGCDRVDVPFGVAGGEGE